MITPEQATEIREFLTKELNTYGFNDIVTEVNTRLEEDYYEEDFKRSPQYLLLFFLKESISVLENLSNKNYEKLIDRFNELAQGETKIEKITVELMNEGKQEYYDLNNLPNYDKIVSSFSEISREIQKEN